MLAKTTVTTIMQHIRMRYLEHGMSCLSDSMNGIIQMSSKDALTLLPNELIFKDRLGQQIRYSTQAQSEFAMLCLDLIDFKSINQRFGREGGFCRKGLGRFAQSGYRGPSQCQPIRVHSPGRSA
jgi:PleD family two-component response regulator